MKVVGAVFAGLAGLGIFFALLYYGGILGNRVQANYQKRVVTSQLEQKVRTPQFMEQAYNHFFDLCAAVQSDEARLDAQYLELGTATTTEDKSRINANISGISSDRADAINEYNADSAKDLTVAQFKTLKLPFRLDTAAYTKGEHTQCAA